MADDSFAGQIGGRFVPAVLRRHLSERPRLAAIVANTSWLAMDKLVRLGLGVLVGVLIARALGPDQFGLLSFLVALLMLFGSFGSLGLDSIIVRELVGDEKQRGVVLGTAFALKSAGGLVALALGTLSAWLLRPHDPRAWHLALIIGAGQLFLAFDAMDFWFQSRLQSRYTVVAKNGAFLIMAIVRLIIIWKHPTIMALGAAVGIEYALAGIGLAVVYTRKAPDRVATWRFRYDTAVELLRQSWPLAFSGLMIAIYMRLDQVMLASMTTDAEVGIYSVAVRLAEVWYFIPVAITTSTLPAVLRSRPESLTRYTARMQKLFTMMAALGYVVALAITVLARPVVHLLYGQSYAGSVGPLIVLAWAGVFVCLGVARENWMLAEGLMTLSFATTAIGAFTNTVLNVVLIPRYGSMGAAYATLVAQATAVFGATLLFGRTRPAFGLLARALALRTRNEVLEAAD